MPGVMTEEAYRAAARLAARAVREELKRLQKLNLRGVGIDVEQMRALDTIADELEARGLGGEPGVLVLRPPEAPTRKGGAS
jgi:hypothetical protein